MRRDKETIYNYLHSKIIVARLQGKLTSGDEADLDGVIWGIAHELCDENQGVPVEVPVQPVEDDGIPF